MRPFLFANTVFETPTYFALFMLAFLAAIILASRRAVLFRLNPVRAVDLGMVTFFFGVAGARIMHIIAEAPSYYLLHPIRVFYFWQGGFVLYGGLILGTIGAIGFLKYFKERIGDWGDLIAPCVFLGIAIGRMGCLAAGCCYGAHTDAWFGLVFTDPRSAAPLNEALYPTQLLEALFAGVLALVFHLKVRKPLKPKGLSFVIGLALYALFRFSIEFIRGDLDRVVYHFGAASISTSQWVSIATFIGCAVWYFIYKKKVKGR